MEDQWRSFLLALATVPGPTWVSEPAHIHAAENKALQLRHARDVGLRVPDTIWTNDFNEARSFIEHWQGTAVVKSVTSAWWEEAGEGRFVFASTVRRDGLPSPRCLASTPVCFQQPVWPKRDVRVTVVGDSALAAIRGADEPDLGHRPLDWRRAPERPWSPYQLAPDVAARCSALVRGFGLRFGGIDLAVDDDGEPWFLELNPNGEWGWLQRAGLPIARALADLLLSEST